MTLHDAESSDGRSFRITVADEGVAAQPGVIYDSPSPFGPFESAATNMTALGTAPAVTGVFVSESTWAPEFKSYLQGQGLGTDAYGYAVTDADQLNELPWNNLNQVSIAFSEDVIVDQAQLLVVGANVAAYGVSAFAYDETTFTATWTLSSALAPNTTSGDKVLLHLSNLVEDLDGERLDGEWANGGTGPDTFPSGDGTAGGAFDFRFNVLPGDANRNGAVNTIDSGEVHARFFSSPTSPGSPPNTYEEFHDINGSGIVLADDYGTATQRYDSTLPASEPAPPAPSVAPSNLSAAVISASQIDLSWSDNSTDETAFLIEGSLDGSTFYEAARLDGVQGTGTVSYSFTEAFPSQQYYFRVAALNGAGASGFAGPAAATTRPPAPDGLIIQQVTESQIDLTWDVLAGMSYTLEWQQDGGTWTAVALGSAGSYSHTALTEAKRYDYRLLATGTGGTSEYSDTIGASTLPASPSGLTAMPGLASDSEIRLDWTDTSGGETGFRIEAEASGAPTREVATAPAHTGSSGIVSYTVTGLAPDTRYQFKVYAFNDSGDSQAAIIRATTGWLTHGEASVASSGPDRTITLGVAGRAENSTEQLPGVHGAAVLLAPAASYAVSFVPNLSTWDSYSPNPGGGYGTGTGFWDSFSVCVGPAPYWDRTDLANDPLDLPFIWGGGNYDPDRTGTGLET